MEQVHKKLSEDSSSLAPGIKAIAWLFIEHEAVDLHSASAFVKRAREGRISRPCITEVQAGPSSQGLKRPFLHTSRPHDPATGKIQGLKNKTYLRFKFPQYLPKKFTDAFLVGLQQQLSVSPSDSILLEHAQKRIAQSLTRNTWRKYESAWNLFDTFLIDRKLPFTCPIPISAETVCRMGRLSKASSSFYYKILHFGFI